MRGFAAGLVLGLILMGAVTCGQAERVMGWSNWMIAGLSVLVLVELRHQS